MQTLTDHEVARLNKTFRGMCLGDKLQEMLSSLEGSSGTPVNAVNASKDLTVSGVVLDGETVTINNPLMTGTDVYEFLADVAQTKTSPTNHAVDITTYAARATGTLTLPTNPTAEDTMTIGTKVYTFKPAGEADVDGEIDLGVNVAATRVNIVAAINGTDGLNTPHTLVRAANFSSTTCAITAIVGGVAGNAVATTETFTATGNVFGAVTLENGDDCTLAEAVTGLVAAITASDTQGVGATDKTNGVVGLTADVAGESGNDITISETMSHGAFAGGATTLSGGVDGTEGVVGQPVVDASYVYFCVADNTISGKNWRRISLGSAY